MQLLIKEETSLYW